MKIRHQEEGGDNPSAGADYFALGQPVEWVESKATHRRFRVPQSLGEQAFSHPERYPQLDYLLPFLQPASSYISGIKPEREETLQGDVPHSEEKVYPAELYIRRAGRLAIALAALARREPKVTLEYTRYLHAVERIDVFGDE